MNNTKYYKLLMLSLASILMCCSNMMDDQKGSVLEQMLFAPGQIRLTSLSTSADSIMMSWSDPSDGNLEYEVVTCDGKEIRIEKGVGACTVTGLSSDTKYAVAITAYSKADHSSDPLTFSVRTTSSGTKTYTLVYTAADMNNVRNDLDGDYLLMADNKPFCICELVTNWRDGCQSIQR